MSRASGEQERVMPTEPENENEPGNVPTQERARERDPVWITLGNMGTTVGEHGQRIERIENKVDVAHDLAKAAASKVDEKVAREVAFSESFSRLTIAIVLLLVLNLAVIVMMLARR